LLALLGPGSLCFLFLELCPPSPGFLSCAQPTRALEIHFMTSQVFDRHGLDLHWSPQALPPPGCLTSVLCPQGLPIAPEALPTLFLDTPGHLLSQVRSSRTQGLGHFRGLSPLRITPLNASIVYYKSGLFNPLELYRSDPSSECVLLWGLAPSDCCSRGFAPRATSPVPWPPGLDTPVLPPSWLQH
jgi:hypothetical protein